MAHESTTLTDTGIVMGVFSGPIFLERLSEALASLRHTLHRPPIGQLASSAFHHQRIPLDFDREFGSRLQMQAIPNRLGDGDLPFR